MRKPKLSENQEIVLAWLKEKYQMGDIELFTLLWRLHVNSEMKKFKERPVYVGFRNLSDKEQAQVLQAFANWALDQC